MDRSGRSLRGQSWTAVTVCLPLVQSRQSLHLSARIIFINEASLQMHVPSSSTVHMKRPCVGDYFWRGKCILLEENLQLEPVDGEIYCITMAKFNSRKNWSEAICEFLCSAPKYCTCTPSEARFRVFPLPALKKQH